MRDHEILDELTHHFLFCKKCEIPYTLVDGFSEKKSTSELTLITHNLPVCERCGGKYQEPVVTSLVALYKQIYDVFVKYYSYFYLSCAVCEKKLIATDAYFCRTCKPDALLNEDSMCDKCAIRLHPGGKEHHLCSILMMNMFLQDPDTFLRVQIDFVEESVRMELNRKTYKNIDSAKIHAFVHSIAKFHEELIKRKMLPHGMGLDAEKEIPIDPLEPLVVAPNSKEIEGNADCKSDEDGIGASDVSLCSECTLVPSKPDVQKASPNKKKQNAKKKNKKKGKKK